MRTTLHILNELLHIIYAHRKLFYCLINDNPLQFGHYPISKRIWEKLKCPCKVGAVKTKINLATRLSIQ